MDIKYFKDTLEGLVENVAPKMQKATKVEKSITPNILDQSFQADLAAKKTKASEFLNSNSFKKISSNSVKNLNPNSAVTIFPKPVTIDQLKSDVYKRYTKEFEDLTGIKLKESDIKALAKETPRFQEIERLEQEMSKFGSKNYTVYGVVSQGGEEFSGFILGTTRISEDSPAVKLMQQQIKNLQGTTISGEELINLENAVTKSIPKNKTYLYSSDAEKPSVAGYYANKTGLSFINTRLSEINELQSTLIHEGLSHATDSILPEKVKQAYKDIIDILKLHPTIPDSSKWQELRATLTELKNKLAPDGNLTTLKNKISKMDSDDLAEVLKDINGYGWDYGQNLSWQPGYKEKTEVLKNAILTLPVGLLAILFGTQAIENSEVPSAKNGGIIKAQDGTRFLIIKEEPEFDYDESTFNFRHLNNEYEAEDLDAELNDLYYRGEIRNGELSKKARYQLQREYNLDNIALKETQEDLINAGYGHALLADLDNRDINDLTIDPQADEDTAILKEGGRMILKADIGAALRKTVGSLLDTLEDKGTSAAAKALFGTGKTKQMGVTITKTLQESAKLTKDPRIQILSEVATFSCKTQFKLPKQFTDYVSAIFKAPNASTSNFTFKVASPEDLEQLSPKLDIAIDSLKSMAKGEEFKFTEAMQDEILLKNKTSLITYPNSKADGDLARKLFTKIEKNKVLKEISNPEYIPFENQMPLKYQEYNAENIRNVQTALKDTREQLGFSQVPNETNPIQMTRINIGKSKGNYNLGYFTFTNNGELIPGAKSFNYQLHHITPMALIRAEAYIKNPKATGIQHLLNYQEVLKSKGPKSDYYKSNFGLLTEPQHLSSEGIHAVSKYDYYDLSKILQLSKSGRFSTLEDLISYYDGIKKKSLELLSASFYL